MSQVLRSAFISPPADSRFALLMANLGRASIPSKRLRPNGKSLEHGGFTGNEQIGIAERNLDRLLHWITRVDAKAGFAFVILTALATSLATRLPALVSLQAMPAAASASAFLLLGTALWYLMAVALPRTRANVHSMFFFGTIQSLTNQGYREAFRALGPDDVLDDLLEQCHRNATILSVKFRNLQWSYRFLYAAFPFWLTAILLLMLN